MLPPRKAVLLLPSHGIEDLPGEPEEDEAAQLLSAFAVLSHPALLNACGAAPAWDRADQPPVIREGDVVLVPGAADVWLEPTFEEGCRQAGAAVVRGGVELSDWAGQVEAAIGAEEAADATRFFAAGVARMMLERMARRMHVWDEIDSFRWHSSLKAAAEAWAAGDGDEQARRLDGCFEQLLEFRERLHPVDPALIDAVLVDGGAAGELLAAVEAATLERPVTFLGDVAAWREVVDAEPALPGRVREQWRERAIDLVVGDAETGPASETLLRPAEETGRRLAEAALQTAELFGRPPRVWGRTTYGLHPQLPQLLKRSGFDAALHFTFDVGSYPDAEDASLTWRGPDGSTVQAMSRLPLPSTRAATLWQLPERLAETVEGDAAAGLMLIRPAIAATGWLDLVREASPVFGRLQTAGEFLVETDTQASVLSPPAREYQSAGLAKRAAADEPDAVSDSAGVWESYLADVRDRVCGGLADLAGASGGGPGVERLAGVIRGLGEPTHELAVNPLPFQVVAETPGGPRRVPPLGFLATPLSAKPAKGPSLVEEGHILRNEFLELHVSRRTGGVQRTLVPGRRGILLSQQLSRRLGETPDGEYAAAECRELDVVENSATAAAIRTRGTLGETGVEFEQTLRLVRGRRWATIDIELKGPVPAAGNPWVLYDAVRWAWAGETIPRAMSSDFDAAAAGRDRLEAPLFLHVGDEPPVTLLFHGLTFHRFSSGRSLDTLLRTHGETRRRFRVSIAVGSEHPAEIAMAADAAADPRLRVPVANPRAEEGWLLQVSRAGVLVLLVAREEHEDGRPRAVVRLRETDGSSRPVRLTLFRPVVEGFARDLVGRLTDRLSVSEGSVEVRLRPHQMRDVVLTLE